MSETAVLQEKMNIVIVGHVDHGKSTVIGRLLADTNSLPQGKLEQVKADCQRNSKPFEYAFLLDALKDEQAQGITIDTARCFFKSDKREYIIIDAPGHIEFLKNMVSGAARAEAALLVIDAQEGIQENSKRHGYLLSMLGIRQVAVCVNKMDLVDYSEETFRKIEKDYTAFLEEIGLTPKVFVPLSAREGENVIQSSEAMSWFEGPNTLQVLDDFEKAASIEDKPLRVPVQDVYKFTEAGDDRRIVVGRVESGTLNVGDEVVFLPSNKRSTVQSLEAFSAPERTEISAGYSTGITLSEQIYINRGDVMCRADEELPQVSSLFRVEIFWMGKRPLVMDRPYKLKIATAQLPVRLKHIERVIDASDLSKTEKREVGRHDVAQCVLETSGPVAFDLTAELEATGRFVVVDDYDIAGGGIILEAIEDAQSDIRQQVADREQNWDFSIIDPQERTQAYGHSPLLVLLTGKVGLDKKTVAKELEKQLFALGAKTYFLGIGNLLRGLNADVEQHRLERHEHVRRLGEVAHLFLDAGIVVIATASDLNAEELRELQTVTSWDRVVIANMDEHDFEEGLVHVPLDSKTAALDNASLILQYLQHQRNLFVEKK